jgi:hypothetical protein
LNDDKEGSNRIKISSHRKLRLKTERSQRFVTNRASKIKKNTLKKLFMQRTYEIKFKYFTCPNVATRLKSNSTAQLTLKPEN